MTEDAGPNTLVNGGFETGDTSGWGGGASVEFLALGGGFGNYAARLVNGTLSPGAGSHEFRELWDSVLLPRLQAFKPQLVLVSAGFDAHRNDPLTDIRLGQEDYAWITERLVALAVTHAGGRLVSSLEGGYDLAALAASTAAHVNSLMA